MNIREIPSKILLLFLFFIFFTGVIGHISYLVGFSVIKLWKEFAIITLFASVIFFRLPSIYKHTLIFIYGLGIFFILYLFNSLWLNITLIIYQFKMDLIIFIFIIAAVDSLLMLKAEKYERTVKKIVKLIISLGFLNGCAIILQRLFSHQFMNLVGFQSEQWGMDIGIKIVATGGHIRSMGLLTYFVPAGTLMLICLIILVETRKYLNRSRKSFVFLFLFFTLSMIYTTYKTAIIGLMVYLFIKIIEKTFGIFKNIVITMFSLPLFLLFLVSTHSYGINDFVAKYNAEMAYNSIFLRVVQHTAVINSMHTIKEFMFGKGAGYNGVFGLDKSVYGIDALALDSTYIYLLSNYGFVFVFLFVIVMTYLIINFFKHKQYDIFGVRYLLFYTLFVEFFYNNFFTSYPTNVVIIVLTVAVIINKRRNLVYIKNIKKRDIIKKAA
ncbi:hypothetical protein [Priestia megaterium]|uniref:hypothetical protein n=1 Tax=Priestia megaterium TaxID=1404 RepID=UPI0039F73DC6